MLAVARVAGIQAAKQTPHLLPLCHPLLVGAVLVNFRLEDTYVEVEANVDTVDRTGVEMEALTAAGVAALTIYDMCKSIDRSMTIGDLALWEKTGGRSGHVAPSIRRYRSSSVSDRVVRTATFAACDVRSRGVLDVRRSRDIEHELSSRVRSRETASRGDPPLVRHPLLPLSTTKVVERS